MKTINYAMTRDYRKEWGPIEAIRELVQNCLDTDHQSTFEYSNGTLSITTKDYTLPLSAFALGESVKEGTSIGGFGEGFKLALLILEREGLSPVVSAGNYTAATSFEHSDVLEREVFTVTLQDITEAFRHTCFVCNFPEELYEELQQKVTVFSHDPLPKPKSNDVDILPDRPGDIFVNGLFVCHEKRFEFGYNFAPNKIELGCDRQIANSLGLAWETSRVWADKFTNPHLVLRMMTEDKLDVQDIHYHISSAQAKKIATAFNERFGAVTIKPMGSGQTYGMSVGGGLYRTMKKSGYAQIANEYAEPNTPYSELEDFMDKHGSKVRREFKVKFQELMEKAKKWRR